MDQYQYPNQQPNDAQYQRPPKPDNYLVWAILTTLFCCLPFGIVSIVYSSKVDTLYYAGDYTNAQQAADKAKKWAMWSAIACAIGVTLYLMFILILAATK
ncbi:MAG: CD225/dispanin family protein [Muribaculaceae bacterium]|nr:CD225/dispanin family protein [Muribaculaceae bacterium]